MMPPREEARLLQALALTPRDHLLEVGTGSGYLAALASGLVRRVTTVEISSERTARAGRSLAEYDNVEIIEGDAVRGWEAAAPYDAIAVTGSLPLLDDAFLRQLKPGGPAVRRGGRGARHGSPPSSPVPVRRTGRRRAFSRPSFRRWPARGAPTSSNSERRRHEHALRQPVSVPTRRRRARRGPALARVRGAPRSRRGVPARGGERTRRSRRRGPSGTPRSNRSRLRSAGLRPNVSFRSSADLISDDVDSTASTSDTYPSLSLSIDVTQPLYRPDRTVRLGQARTSEEKAEIDYAVQAQDLIDRVVVRYFGVLQAGDDFRFAQTNREAIGQQLRQAQQRFEVGLIAITDVEEAKSRFDLASAREIEAKNALDNAREAMREIIGEYPDDLASLGEDLPLAVPDPADIDEWTRTAVERNLPVRAASFAVAIAKESIRLAGTGDRTEPRSLRAGGGGRPEPGPGRAGVDVGLGRSPAPLAPPHRRAGRG